ncbi:MAG: sulfatase-like hydrolase/transferase, partial [Verrucomicrobiaceae bacterium]
FAQYSPYDAEIAYADEVVGRLIHYLKAHQLYDRSTIVLLSDHGEGLGDHGEQEHGLFLYTEAIHVPLIVKQESNVGAGRRIADVVQHIDIVPTILEVAGGKPFATWEGQPVPPAPGKSLAPLFTKDGAMKHDSLWWMHEGNRALRADDWKIVAAGKDSPWELYDMSRDRSESKNLAAEKPEKVSEMAAEWARQNEEYCALARKDLPATTKEKPQPQKQK